MPELTLEQRAASCAENISSELVPVILIYLRAAVEAECWRCHDIVSQLYDEVRLERDVHACGLCVRAALERIHPLTTTPD